MGLGRHPPRAAQPASIQDNSKRLVTSRRGYSGFYGPRWHYNFFVFLPSSPGVSSETRTYDEPWSHSSQNPTRVVISILIGIPLFDIYPSLGTKKKWQGTLQRTLQQDREPTESPRLFPTYNTPHSPSSDFVVYKHRSLFLFAVETAGLELGFSCSALCATEASGMG